jgi:hypothetical protein
MEYLYRKDDGEMFTKQSDGKYTMDNSHMYGSYPEYRYSYAALKSVGFVKSLEECVILKHIHKYEGCGGDESC